MKVEKDNVLPPWVEVEKISDKDLWISTAISVMPVSEYSDNSFDGLVLTSDVVNSRSDVKYVELRLEKREFIVNNDGVAEFDDDPLNGRGKFHVPKTIAWGSVRLGEFVKKTDCAPGRSVASYIFTFYEDGIDVVATSVAGGCPQCDPQVVVNVCRGYDKPKNELALLKAYAGFNYANMTFLFNECGRGFGEYRRRIEARYA